MRRGFAALSGFVSVLFSEPKIPQTLNATLNPARSTSFSALQRAENSSNKTKRRTLRAARVSVLFSEPKIPQICEELVFEINGVGFSALQRAENSSKDRFRLLQLCVLEFQCSSASRKFLKSALPTPRGGRLRVSVLFSEPKIPQTRRNPETPSGNGCFSALQRAENSSKEAGERRDRGSAGFQCSSASRKFLKRTRIWGCAGVLTVSVLFSEPKIPQTTTKGSSQHRPASFSALQRAENSSKASSAPSPRRAASVSVLFSEPKIPQIGARIVATIGHKPFQCSSASRKFLKRSGARRASKR